MERENFFGAMTLEAGPADDAVGGIEPVIAEFDPADPDWKYLLIFDCASFGLSFA